MFDANLIQGTFQKFIVKDGTNVLVIKFHSNDVSFVHLINLTAFLSAACIKTALITSHNNCIDNSFQ